MNLSLLEGRHWMIASVTQRLITVIPVGSRSPVIRMVLRLKNKELKIIAGQQVANCFQF